MTLCHRLGSPEADAEMELGAEACLGGIKTSERKGVEGSRTGQSRESS